jgi:hypothetical protein
MTYGPAKTPTALPLQSAHKRSMFGLLGMIVLVGMGEHMAERFWSGRHCSSHGRRFHCLPRWTFSPGSCRSTAAPWASRFSRSCADFPKCLALLRAGLRLLHGKDYLDMQGGVFYSPPDYKEILISRSSLSTEATYVIACI